MCTHHTIVAPAELNCSVRRAALLILSSSESEWMLLEILDEVFNQVLSYATSNAKGNRSKAITLVDKDRYSSFSASC